MGNSLEENIYIACGLLLAAMGAVALIAGIIDTLKRRRNNNKPADPEGYNHPSTTPPPKEPPP